MVIFLFLQVLHNIFRLVMLILFMIKEINESKWYWAINGQKFFFYKLKKTIRMSSINKFAALAGLIKNVKRTGWLRYLPAEHVESVGDHSAKIAMLALYLRNIENVNYSKCV